MPHHKKIASRESHLTINIISRVTLQHSVMLHATPALNDMSDTTLKRFGDNPFSPIHNNLTKLDFTDVTDYKCGSTDVS